MTQFAIDSALDITRNIMPLLFVYNATFLTIRVVLSSAFRGKL